MQKTGLLFREASIINLERGVKLISHVVGGKPELNNSYLWKSRSRPSRGGATRAGRVNRVNVILCPPVTKDRVVEPCDGLFSWMVFSRVD